MPAVDQEGAGNQWYIGGRLPSADGDTVSSWADRPDSVARRDSTLGHLREIQVLGVLRPAIVFAGTL